MTMIPLTEAQRNTGLTAEQLRRAIKDGCIKYAAYVDSDDAETWADALRYTLTDEIHDEWLKTDQGAEDVDSLALHFDRHPTTIKRHLWKKGVVIPDRRTQ